MVVGVLAGATIFFGLLFGFHASRLSVSPQVNIDIDPLELLSLIVTVFLAIIVMRTLHRKDDGEKVERDILIEYFKEFSTDLMGDLHKIIADEGGESSELAAIFQRHGIVMQELSELARSHSSTHENSLAALERNVSQLRELFLNTPREGEVEDGVRIDGTKIRYSLRHISDITASMARFRREIFSMIKSINRS